MALVHQRIRRIFFAFPNPHAGALGSVHRLQGEESLNHHYAVFRVLVPEQSLAIIEKVGSLNGINSNETHHSICPSQSLLEVIQSNNNQRICHLK